VTTAVHKGDRNCYLHGCREPACVNASTRYTKRLRLEHSRGQYRMTDAAPVRHHIKRLMAAGWTQTQISDASQVPSANIHKLYSSPQQKTANWRATAILAIEITTPPADPRHVDATGSRRRLQALRVLGHRRYDLAAELGTTPDRIKHITNGRARTLPPEEAAAITRLYRTLSTVPGPSKQTASIARNSGWHGPLAWDDIDNPKARPLTGGREQAGASRKRKVRADTGRVARLTAEGLSVAQIARQIGCHERTVSRARRRAELQQAA
jgi:hypothetical protein